MIQELVSFISQYDPEFPRKIRGASQQEIEKLERLASRPMPAAYREFLANMGKDAGNSHAPEETFRIQLVLGFYETHGKSWSQDYLFIGQLRVEPPVDYYLELSGPGVADGRVVGVDQGERPTRGSAWPYFPSLRDMLFSRAFHTLRVLRMQYRKTFTPRLVRSKGQEDPEVATTLNSVSGLALRLGFQKLAFTSERNPMFDRGDAVILGNQHPHGDGFSFELASNSEFELKKLEQIVRDHLPVNVRRD